MPWPKKVTTVKVQCKHCGCDVLGLHLGATGFGIVVENTEAQMYIIEALLVLKMNSR
jgi:hypothetical protein